MSAFLLMQARRDRLAAAIDANVAERVRLVPMRAGKYVGGGADPDRAPVEVVAPLLTWPEAQPLSGDRRRGEDASTAEIAAAPVVLRLAPGTVAEPPRKGDRVEAIERAPVEVFEVTAPPVADGAGRIVVRLVRVP